MQYCTGNDPYAKCFQGDSKGNYDCTNTAVCVRAIWEKNRKEVHRDVTHLFTGTPVSTVDRTIGCAWLYSCPKTNTLSYAALNIGYTTDIDAQKYLGKEGDKSVRSPGRACVCFLCFSFALTSCFACLLALSTEQYHQLHMNWDTTQVLFTTIHLNLRVDSISCSHLL